MPPALPPESLGQIGFGVGIQLSARVDCGDRCTICAKGFQVFFLFTLLSVVTHTNASIRSHRGTTVPAAVMLASEPVCIALCQH